MKWKDEGEESLNPSGFAIDADTSDITGNASDNGKIGQLPSVAKSEENRNVTTKTEGMQYADRKRKIQSIILTRLCER